MGFYFSPFYSWPWGTRFPYPEATSKYIPSASFQRCFVQTLVVCPHLWVIPAPTPTFYIHCSVPYWPVSWRLLLNLGIQDFLTLAAEHSAVYLNNILFNLRLQWAGRIFSTFCFTNSTVMNNLVCLPLCKSVSAPAGSLLWSRISVFNSICICGFNRCCWVESQLSHLLTTGP